MPGYMPTCGIEQRMNNIEQHKEQHWLDERDKICAPTIEEALAVYPRECRYVGLMIPIKGKMLPYRFVDGIEDEHLVSYIPHSLRRLTFQKMSDMLCKHIKMRREGWPDWSYIYPDAAGAICWSGGQDNCPTIDDLQAKDWTILGEESYEGIEIRN